MDQLPPDSAKPPATAAEQAAARAVAVEESARQRAWLETARSSTTVISSPIRRTRLLLPVLVIISITLALVCAILLHQMHRLESPEPMTRRRLPSTTRAPLAPRESPAEAPTPSAPLVVPDAQPLALTSAPPPTPLVITIPVAAPPLPDAPAAEPSTPPTAPLSADERRQLLLYQQRLMAGTDLLGRDLAEREQTIARTQRRLTFEPDRQPPMGAVEELAEAIRYWEGAVGDERERFAATVHNRRAEVANLQRQLLHDQEVAESLRKRLDNARQELDGVRKKLGPPP